MRRLIGIGLATAAAFAVVMSASARSSPQTKGAEPPPEAPAPPLPTQIKCIGKVCGGAGGTLQCGSPLNQNGRYVYRVIPGTNVSVDSVEIGTDINNLALYTSICAPPGWFIQSIDPIARAHGAFTAHGSIGTISSQCQFIIKWQGAANPQSSAFELGFQVLNSAPHDVSWHSLSGGGVDRTSNWSFPVGKGTGPVHGPLEADPPPPPPPPDD